MLLQRFHMSILQWRRTLATSARSLDSHLGFKRARDEKGSQGVGVRL